MAGQAVKGEFRAKVHMLVTAAFLRVTCIDAFDADAPMQPPHAEFAQVRSLSSRSPFSLRWREKNVSASSRRCLAFMRAYSSGQPK
jgi:hypothetical protein